MSVGSRPAIPPCPRGNSRDRIVTRLATCVTVLAAVIAVLVVAAAAVALTIS
jgi:hypothetical protein